MAQLEKLKEDFRQSTGPYPWKDAVRLLSLLGYEQLKGGKTGGSRVAFYNAKSDHLIRVHKPHKKEMKAYSVREVREALEAKGLL